MVTVPAAAAGTRAMTGGAIWDEAAVSVLVADDHPMWREAVARDLADAGFTRRRNGG